MTRTLAAGTGSRTLGSSLDHALARLDTPDLASVVNGNGPFLDATKALEQCLRAVSARLGKLGKRDDFAAHIRHAPLDEGERKWLHDLRSIRNALVHYDGVQVSTDFAREVILRLRPIAAVVDGLEVVAATVMVPNPRVVRPDDPIAKAQGLMLAQDYSQLPVCSPDGCLVGAVTDRSILRRLRRRGLVVDPRQVLVEEALEPAAMTVVTPEAPLVTVSQALLGDSQLRAVVVVDQDKVLGIITHADLLRFWPVLVTARERVPVDRR